ncbi:MAG: hypothetical protein WA364_07280 [Candidatus Nitrosopolaris sp.]
MLLAGHAPSGVLNEASQVIDISINNCSSSNTSHHGMSRFEFNHGGGPILNETYPPGFNCIWHDIIFTVMPISGKQWNSSVAFVVTIGAIIATA